MAQTHDESFREIQLGGKQLVFLAMAVVVIGVSLFLMGVMVGRGVLAARGAAGADSIAAAAESDLPPPPPSASVSSSSTPATAGEKLSYAERLGSAEPPTEPLKPEAGTPAEAPSPKPESAPPPSAPAAAPAPAPPAPVAAAPAPPPTTAAKAAGPAAAIAEPAGTGFTIQIAAVREAEEADAIVKRLAGKGYPAYVVAPARGSAPLYRVRVGKYQERREADTVAARLQKEEQFKPWVVR
ncbi:MAG: SPOR domain-containing protein [Acidimicrobiia bacterium]|nr:SPOR domain-containing protein [Acidimicrobiia bacterium]